MFNKLPALSDPVRYAGLYIFDFGTRVAVGYTAQEIRYLLDDPKYAGGSVYKIYRAHSDGTLEIRRIEPAGLSSLTGMVFHFADRADAIAGAEHLKKLSLEISPPERFELFVMELTGEDWPFVMVMRYNQECEDELAAWMIKIDYTLGSRVEGGRLPVAQVLKKGTEVLREHIGAEDTFRRSRSRTEVLESVDLSVQR
ncbi:MAG: hypothetical protein GX629_09855 [Phycisphaerae bacterium]|jgi:hypothetical protein|nr:hypothetical protein [Phycisphaerae bacterium]